jgi:acyl carrier protein
MIERIKQILCDCLCEENVDGIILTQIDSLDRIDLLFHIENEYDVHIDRKEAAALTTIDELVLCVTNKLNEKNSKGKVP